MHFAQAREHPADLLVIARVVGARPEVDLTAAAAEMRDDEGQAAFGAEVGEGFGVVAARGAFEAVEEDEKRPFDKLRANGRFQPIDVDEVAARTLPILTDDPLRRSLGCAGREHVRRSFTVEQMAARYEATYRCA